MGAAEATVEKANLEDTVCRARGQRLHSIDSRDPLSQRLVVLGVFSGKEVELKTWVMVATAELGSRSGVTRSDVDEEPPRFDTTRALSAGPHSPARAIRRRKSDREYRRWPDR